MQCEPFALDLYRRFAEDGKTPEEIATETGISAERVRARLRAAVNFIRKNLEPVAIEEVLKNTNGNGRLH